MHFLSNFQFSILNFESGCDVILPREEGILKVPIWPQLEPRGVAAFFGLAYGLIEWKK